MGERKSWMEPLGAHRLTDTLETAERLAKGYECTTPAYGAPGYAHCAACCYGTGIAASSMEEFETAQVLGAVPSLIAAIEAERQRRLSTIDAILGVLDEFRAWMWDEATEGDGARRWGVQHVLDHYDEPLRDALLRTLSDPSRARDEPREYRNTVDSGRDDASVQGRSLPLGGSA